VVGTVPLTNEANRFRWLIGGSANFKNRQRTKLAATKSSSANFKSANRKTSENEWISLTYIISIEKAETMKTPGKQPTCSSGSQWLSNGVMRSPSTTLSPPSNAVVVLLA